MSQKFDLKELLDIATNEEPSNALMQELVLLAFDAGKLKQIKAQDEVLKQIKRALGEAVAVIYFEDSSDYLSALWTIVRELGGDDAVNLLESDDHAAYEKYSKDRNTAPNAKLIGRSPKNKQ